MSRLRYLAEIKQLEQLLANQITAMENEYPEQPYKSVNADIRKLEFDTQQLSPSALHPSLRFNILNKNSNFTFMAVVTSLNLTSAAPVQLFMTVIDPSGNVIAGVASGFSYAVADPTQDIAVVDPTLPADVDIHAVSSTGGTTVTPTANFVSTLMQADGITPVFSGPITGPALTLTNNIPVVTLTPSLAFNQ